MFAASLGQNLFVKCLLPRTSTSHRSCIYTLSTILVTVAQPTVHRNGGKLDRNLPLQLSSLLQHFFEQRTQVLLGLWVSLDIGSC